MSEHTAEKDVVALADEVARILHPHPYREPDERGRYTRERPANGNDSTMTVFLAADGHNSMRALTYREVCEAVLASDWFKARVFPPGGGDADG
ncbi:MAG TPA: hypothetical protein VFH56_14015 [Acidimicrobiales bacterium]|nr:hypothetical protein [Acidimicrobiales bacterium]